MSNKTTLREFINSLEKMSDDGKNDGLPVMVCHVDIFYDIADWGVNDVFECADGVSTEYYGDGSQPLYKAVTIE